MATGLGIAAGDLIHTCMAVLGLSAILMTSAFLFNVVKYAGAAYLVYLGVRAFLEQADLPELTPAARVDARTAFRQAILAEVLNPKSALFFLAFLPQFVRPQNGPVALQLATLGVLFVLMGALSTGLVALCAGRVGRFLRRHPAIWRWQGQGGRHGLLRAGRAHGDAAALVRCPADAPATSTPGRHDGSRFQTRATGRRVAALASVEPDQADACRRAVRRGAVHDISLGKRRAGDGAGRARAGRASAVRQAGRGGGSGAGPIGRCRSVADAPGLRPESRAAGLLAVARRRVRRALVRADGPFAVALRHAGNPAHGSGAGSHGLARNASPPAIEFCTGANRSDEVPIRQSACRWTRIVLADGSAARLVETL